MSATDDITSNKDEDDFCEGNLDHTSEEGTAQGKVTSNENLSDKNADLDDSLPVMSTSGAQCLLSGKEKESITKIRDILTLNQDTIHENVPTINLSLTFETSKGSGDDKASTEEGLKSGVSEPDSGDGTKENSTKSIDDFQNDDKQLKNISSELNIDDIDDIILKWDDDDGSNLNPDDSAEGDTIQKDQDLTDESDKTLEREPTPTINKADSPKSLEVENTDKPTEELANLRFKNEPNIAENKDNSSKSLDVASTDKQPIEELDNSELGIEPNLTKNNADSPKSLEVEASTDENELIPDIATNKDTSNENLQEEKLLETVAVTEEKNNEAMEINEEELLREDAKESEMDIDPSNNSIEENLEKATEVDKSIIQYKPLVAEDDNESAKDKEIDTNLAIKDKPKLLNTDIAEIETDLVEETENALNKVNNSDASKTDKLQKYETTECKSTVDKNDDRESENKDETTEYKNVIDEDDKTDENKEETIKIKNTDDGNDREDEIKDITTQTNNIVDNNDDEKDDIKKADNVSLEINRKTLGFNKPDVMLEIPTQELIDIDDIFDSSNDSKVEDTLIYNKFGDESDEKNDGDDKIDNAEEKNKEVSEKPIEVAAAPTMEATPSTSKTNELIPDTLDELPEVTDSLGLLAESRRVMDDDDEQYDDGDDDDDSDLDESSNQMTAEHSEDSNTPHSETEPGREEQEGDTEDNMLEAEDNMAEAEDNMAEAEDTIEGADDNLEIAEDNIEAEDNEIVCDEDFGFTVNDVQMKVEKEGVVGENVEPLLPGLKTAVTEGVSEIKIKEEKYDSEPRTHKRTDDTVAKCVRKRDRPSAASSNDDVIEQTVEIETVKLSDDEDEKPVQASTEETAEETVEQNTVQQTEKKIEDVKKAEESTKEAEETKVSPKSSPSKLKNLSIAKAESVVNFVDLEESSSEDDTQVSQESQLKKLLESKHIPPAFPTDGITINIPTGIDIMSSSTTKKSAFTMKEGEVVISGVPKPPPHKPARLNTSEVTIKTASSSEQTLVIPETKLNDKYQDTKKPKLGLEIFSLDSDEEDNTAEKQEEPKRQKSCINFSCTSGVTEFLVADSATAAFYDASKKKKPLVCGPCADAVLDRQKKLVEGIKNMTPLLNLDIISIPQDLVEILDSESEDEDTPLQQGDVIGEEAAGFLEDNLAELLNKTWKHLNLDDRLKETQNELNTEIEKLEADSKEINQMLIDCQHATDKLRSELYATFECTIQELPSIVIYETPEFNYIGPEADNVAPPSILESRLNAKRKISSGNETPAKRPAIPLGYAPLGDPKSKTLDIKVIDNKADDDKDISVVKLSVESAPPDLPPVGECLRPPLKVGMQVYAMKNAFGPWLKGKIVEIMPKSSNPSQFTLCRVKFDHKQTKTNGKVLPGRCIAYAEPAEVRMTIGTRIIALFKGSNKRESYYSGVVAEIPNPVNSYRYLVFFDDGYAQYVHHSFTRIVVECSPLVWEEVHPLSREFVREYLMAYPERPMVRLHEGQHLKTEWDGKWWSSRVSRVDASLAQVVFAADGRREWVYRGSTRLAPLYLELRAAERHRPRPMPRTKQLGSNMPYVEYTRSDEPAAKTQDTPAPISTMTIQQQQQNEEMRRQRAVAKKSTVTPATAATAATTQPPAPAVSSIDTLSSRVVYYTPKNAVRPHKLVPHKCSPKCKRSDVLSLKELRTYNPLAKPLLSGWERQIVRFKGQREVMYRAPCGRRLRNMKELHRYLRLTNSELPVDLFDFYHATHCLAEFVLNKCLVGKKDLSHGKENVPVPCVNYYDESLPEFCSYNTERTPTSGVPLNLDPEFLCGCDCTDDCEDKSKCACWKLTLEGARTIGLDGPNIGYEYKRLPEPLPSGIYECNSRCKCKETCLNRVAQHPLQLKLQVFKTLNRGWGIRALNDVPKGAFLCVYAGNLLTDATANLDGLNEGDEYLAELDYIEVVEQMKENYEEDIPEADKKLDKKESVKEESEEESTTSSEEDDTATTDKEDDDFRPGHIGLGVMEFNKRLRRRGRNKKEEKEMVKKKENDKEKESNEDDCITISDDEEVREPLRFTAQPGMGGNDFISKYRSVRSYFGEDEACYIMDAKVQGNIGRYLNHSCSPNVFVQNVFVDTHDPRFPWVAFFALSHIKAGTELTWNYNYDVGSVPGKVLYCYCEAPNCRGRLL